MHFLQHRPSNAWLALCLQNKFLWGSIWSKVVPRQAWYGMPHLLHLIIHGSKCISRVMLRPITRKTTHWIISIVRFKLTWICDSIKRSELFFLQDHFSRVTSLDRVKCAWGSYIIDMTLFKFSFLNKSMSWVRRLHIAYIVYNLVKPEFCFILHGWVE